MLSEQDVMLLMQAKSSPAARAEVATKVAATFARETLSQSELELAQDIIRAMVRDVAVEVRSALSENLKSSPQLPREVALQLAQDVESVSLPVLEFSKVLTVEDLVKVIETSKGASSSAKYTAIARREEVPEIVADALVEHADEQAIAVLVSNKGADISDKSLQKVVDKFPESTPVHTGLVKRDRLPITVAEQLVTMVADSLRDHLVAKHELPAHTAADMVLQSRERAIVQLVAKGAEGPEDIEVLIRQMYANKRLTPNLVLRALCMGDITFFEASLAVMTGIPLVNARLLIHDAGRLGLKTLYEKSGMPLRFLPAVRVAMDVVKETEFNENDSRETFRNRVIERILTQYEDLGEEDLEYLLSKIVDHSRPAGQATAAATA
jgi:uncharacterized protein (DUF2336 family)